MRRWIVCGMVLGAAVVLTAQTAQQDAARKFVLDRARSLELNTPYVPPPGDPLVHYTSGYAKVMCSAVFITGLDPDFAQEHVGYFTGPYEARAKVGKPVVDRAGQAVHITMPDGVTRTAKYLGSQGCVTLPIGQKDVFYTPVAVKSALPDPATQDWPMGDRLPATPLPAELDAAKLKQATDLAFDPDGFTAAFVVTWKGRIDRRALRREHHPADAARELVDGQEPQRHPDGRAAEARRLRPVAGRRRFPSGRAPAIRARRSALPTSCTCRADSGSRRRRIPSSIRTAPIPIISTSTRRRSTRSSTPPPVRPSGRPTPLAAIATPTRCSSTT